MPVLFRNPGLIDIRALLTLGVNSKPSSNSPIGYFGTGAKFAIATFLRLGCSVKVFRAADTLESYDFSVSPTTIRGKSFDIVTVNGQELGFTTALGRAWEAWMAFRELYSNARDENGGMEWIGTRADWHPEPGETAIIVEGDAVESAWKERHAFILSTRPYRETAICDIHLPNSPDQRG